METLVDSVTPTQILDKDERSRVSGSPGSNPVQTGLVEVCVGEKKDDVFMVDENCVVQVSMIEGETKMTGNEGKRKSLRKQSKNEGKIDVGGVSGVKDNGGNGVYKLLNGVPENGEEGDNGSKQVGEEEEEEEEGGEMGDEEHDFSVGDVVWGKIKSHPWWPGQIYNSSDASAAAAKYKRKNRLLVAYFGDGTFAWCHPSQLKPFQEEFDQLAKQSNSKSFLKAVEGAVNEIGRRLELEMACSCLAFDQRPVKLVTWNAGINEGVAVPDTGMGELSITRYEPVEFLAHLKYIAQVVSIDNMLDLLVLQHRLSAFFRAKGYKQLPEYHEPMQILVTGDTAGNGLTHKDNVEGQTEDLNGSPVEADWLSPSADPGVGSTGITINRRWSGISEEKLLQSKKRRSMAELMAGNTDVKGDEIIRGSLAEEGTIPRTATVRRKKRREIMGSEVGNENFVAEELDSSRKQTVASRTKKKTTDTKVGNDHDLTEDGNVSGKTTQMPRKRRMNKGSEDGYNDVAAEGKNMEDSLLGNANDVAEKLTVSNKQTIGSRTRKKIQESKIENNNNVGKELTLSGEGTVVSGKRKKNKDFEVGNDKDAAEELTPSGKHRAGSRRRKENMNSELGNDTGKIEEGSSDSKHASHSKMPKTAKLTGQSVRGENKASNVENGDFGTGGLVEEGPSSGKQASSSKTLKKTILTGSSVTGEDKASNVENDDLGTNETNKSGASLRERKKSKYLSPPYTNLSPWQRLVISIDDSKKENPNIPSISREGESVTRVSGEATICPPIVKCGKTFDTELTKKSRPESNTSVLDEGNASAHEMLSDFRSAALDPLYLRKKQSDDTIKGFFSKFRSSLYQSGSDFARGSKKRVSFETKPDSPAKDAYETGDPVSQGESERKKKKKKKDEMLRSPKPNSKHAGDTSDMQTNLKGEANGDISAAALTLTFAPGVSLPSKDELITTFRCFGALKESETKVLEDSGCAWIVYARSSDAEKVYHSFEKLTSFGSSVVSHRLRYLPAVSKASGNTENSHQHHHSIPSPMKGGNISSVQSTSHSQVGDAPSLLLVRQNLEMATSVLEKSWDKMSSDVKANLGGEIKDLLNKIFFKGYNWLM